ncbi:MAG: hypothetical protein JNM53_10710 [Gemmatimonadetes bacterium]|nr:hypothetical protein [Gemmatimonadota bacterium]
MRIAGGPSLTLRHGSALIGALLALGCSEEATGPRPVPVGIVVASAAEQVGTAGEPLDSMLTAFVYDKFGDPVPGVLVRFSVPAGNGSVTPVARTTGPDGHASAAWLLPTRTGSYQAHAAAAGFDSLTFGALARPGKAAALAVVTGDAQSGAAGTAVDSAVVVEVRDVHGNGVPGRTVLFSTREGSGRVVPARAESDSLGRVYAVWTLGKDGGVHGLTVRVDSLPPLRIRATAVQSSPLMPLAQTHTIWPDYSMVVPGALVRLDGDRVVETAPRRALECWRNALGEVALEGGGCGVVGGD